MRSAGIRYGIRLRIRCSSVRASRASAATAPARSGLVLEKTVDGHGKCRSPAPLSNGQPAVPARPPPMELAHPAARLLHFWHGVGLSRPILPGSHRRHQQRPRDRRAATMAYKGTIGILTGGGDVPGLNPAIRAITIRALREGYRVLGIRRGWAGLSDLIRDPDADNSNNVQVLTEDVVNRAGRTGGTFLHTSRTRPSFLPRAAVPPHLQDKYHDDVNDLTPEVLKNLEWLGIDTLIPIGGDDTLSYAQRLHQEGVRIVAVPKTMDNDVPGTDYCIGFSTCVTRTIELTNRLRTSAGSHERFLVVEVFGRYAGFTALLPTMAGAAHRCVIPEHPFDIEIGRAHV